MTTPLDPLGPTGLPDDIVDLNTAGSSGTWTPQIVPCWVRGRITGAGAKGEDGSTATGTTTKGGGAGAVVEFVEYVTGPINYAVGAPGTGSSNGGASSFGPYSAPGGMSVANGRYGGGYDPSGTQHVMAGEGVRPGGAGGGTGGGNKTAGRAPGLVLQPSSSTVPLGGGDGGNDAGSYVGGSGGGSSADGKGGRGGDAVSSGTGAAGAAGDGYGSGGGGGGCGPAAGGAGGAGKGGRVLLAVFYG